jgi:hypothetical protein
MGLDNEATNVTYFNSDTGQIVTGATISVPSLYSKGENGGFVQILAAIKNNNYDYVDMFFAYGRALRAHNKIKEGKVVPKEYLEDSGNGVPNYKVALGYAKIHPEIAVAFHNLQKWNDGMVDFAVDTNVLSKEAGALWKQYADYVPFYLNLDGTLDEELNTKLREELDANDDFRILNKLLPGPPSKEYKGIKHNELVDPVEATLRNVTAIITSGLANVASTRALMNAVITGDARRLDPTVDADKVLMSSPHNQVVEVFENGNSVKYRVNDVPLLDLLRGAFDGDVPLTGLTNMLSKPAGWLREGVTRMPDFIISNTSRDAWLSWLSHKSSTDPFSATVNSIKRISSDYIAGYGAQDTLGKMERTGAHGGYEGKDLKFDTLKKRLSKQINYSSSPVEILSKTWKALGEVSSLSEASARQRVFEMVHKQYLPIFMQQGKEEGLTGQELSNYAEIHATAQAGFQSMEVLNFARRGNAPLMKFVTATIPFVNARIQGMDVFWRNGYLGENVLGLDQDAAKRAMMRRIAIAFSGSVIYAAMMHSDWFNDDYERESEHTRFDNWLIPLGPLATEKVKHIAIPSPFEAGLFVKLLPEQLVRLAMGEGSGESLRAFNHAWSQTMALTPIPQAVKPLIEHATGYNFFTGERIVPFYLDDMDPAEQYRESTSGIAKLTGKALPEWMGMSPLEIENIMRGYLGSAFNYITFFTDYAIHRPWFGLTGLNDKPQSLATDNPLFKKLFKGRALGGQDFYDMREEVDNVTNTMRILRGRDPTKAQEYLNENREVLRMKGILRGYEKQLKNIRSQRKALVRRKDLSRRDRMKIQNYLDEKQRDIYGRASESIHSVR